MPLRSPRASKWMFVLSLCFLASSWAIANLEIHTDMEHAVQTIKKTIYTPSGMESGSPTIVIDANGDNAIKVVGKIQAGANTNNINSDAKDSSILAGSGNKINVGSSNVILGGEENTISGERSTIGGGIKNQINGNVSSILAGQTNTIINGNTTTILGGKDNTINGERSTIGGGLQNNIIGNISSIIGGKINKIIGPYNNIGGGQNNYISGKNSSILGGLTNNITGDTSIIIGGWLNTISGSYASIIGGRENKITADYGIAGGKYAQVLHEGSFVWSDSFSWYPLYGEKNFTSTDDNQFLIRAKGGLGVNTNAPGAAIQVVGSAIFGDGGNTISGENNFIAGGTAGGPNTIVGDFNTIGGGIDNSINGTRITIGGGYYNTATGNSATIGGGADNQVNGYFSTIIGGRYNVINGDYSVAAGSNAKALHDKTFVRSDGTYFGSTNTGQFLIRASNGVGINTNTTDMGNLTIKGVGNAGGLSIYQGGAGNVSARMYLSTNDNLHLTRNGSDVAGIIIKPNGIVGIGDDTPAGNLQLDVAGKVGADEYCDGAGNHCSTAAEIENVTKGITTCNVVIQTYVDGNNDKVDFVARTNGTTTTTECGDANDNDDECIVTTNTCDDGGNGANWDFCTQNFFTTVSAGSMERVRQKVTKISGNVWQIALAYNGYKNTVQLGMNCRRFN